MNTEKLMLCGHSESSYDSQMICNECIDEDENALAAADALADEIEKCWNFKRGVPIDVPEKLAVYRKARGEAYS